MTPFQFKLLSDRIGPYTVVFADNPDLVPASCDCEVGARREACKHLISVLHMAFGYRRTTKLISQNKQLMPELASRLRETDLGRSHDCFVEYHGRFKMAQRDYMWAKENLSRAAIGMAVVYWEDRP